MSELEAPGSATWAARFHRRHIWSGELFRWALDGTVGASATWASCESSLAESGAHEAEIARHAREGATAGAILERLRLDDARWALDALGSAGGPLRHVLVDVAPYDLDDPVTLYRAATELAADIDRPGTVVALPALQAGFEVGMVLVGEGISVAFDPILTPGALAAALDAYHRGVEARRRVGASPGAVAAFGIAPLDRLQELASSSGLPVPPSPAEAARALDLARDEERTVEDAPPFRLIGPGPARPGWIRELHGDPEPEPEGAHYAWTGEGAEVVQAAALAERTTASRVAHARLLERVETLRARSLAPILSPLRVEPAPIRVAAQARAQTWPGDFDNVADRLEESMTLLELFADVAEQLQEAEIEEVLWLAPATEAAAARAFVEATGHLDGAPELVIATPELAGAALEALAEAAVVVISGLDDDRAMTRVARAALERLSPEQVVAVARPGSSLQRLAEQRDVLAVLEPLVDDPTEADLFALTAVFPAFLAGADPDAMIAQLEAMLGACSVDLPPRVHAGVQLASALLAYADEGGEGLEVVTSPALAGFRSWLASRPGLDALGLRVDGSGPGRITVYVEGEPGFEPPASPPESPLVLSVALTSRVQITQEMLRWTIALELAETMDASEAM